jgi:hypothetical protein
MGWRALRLALDRTALKKTQARALVGFTHPLTPPIGPWAAFRLILAMTYQRSANVNRGSAIDHGSPHGNVSLSKPRSLRPIAPTLRGGPEAGVREDHP